MLDCQRHAPVTSGFEVTDSAFSTASRSVTDRSKCTITGIPTPTVHPSPGWMLALIRFFGLNVENVDVVEETWPSVPVAVATSVYRRPEPSGSVSCQDDASVDNSPSSGWRPALSCTDVSRPPVTRTLTLRQSRATAALPATGSRRLLRAPGTPAGPQTRAGRVRCTPPVPARRGRRPHPGE